jgi:hypothetical protein
LGIKDLSIVDNAMASEMIEVKVVSMNLNSYQPIPVEIKGGVLCRD